MLLCSGAERVTPPAVWYPYLGGWTVHTASEGTRWRAFKTLSHFEESRTKTLSWNTQMSLSEEEPLGKRAT